VTEDRIQAEVQSLTMGIEQYMRLCEKLRAKSQGNTAELDHSALHLDDANISRFADSLLNSSFPVPALSLNLSQIGKSRRNGGNSWMPDGLDRLVHYIRNSPSLLDIRLAGSESCSAPTLFHAVVTHFLEAIENNPSIQRLTLYNVDLEAETFARLVRRSKTLQHLSITRCSLYKRTIHRPNDEKIPSCTHKMAASFGLNKSITSLRMLDIEECFLLPILEQLKSHRHIQKLDLTCNSTAVATAIGQLVSGGKLAPPFLNHLILRDSSLLGFESLVRHLTNGSSPVQRLDVIHCAIDAVSASLLRTLFRCRKHSIQHVSFCDVTMDDDSNWEEIFQGLHGSSTISRLTIHRVAFQERDYRSLMQLLQNNQNLTQVNLDRKILATMGNHCSKNDMSKSSDAQPCINFTFSRVTGALSPGFTGTCTTV
jgi:hypothetical protein